MVASGQGLQIVLIVYISILQMFLSSRQSSIEVMKKFAHPSQKPVPLLRYLIEMYTDRGDTVLDNTMGSGSTGVACCDTGRKFIGIEQRDGLFQYM